MTDDLEARRAALAARRQAPTARRHAAPGGRRLAAGLSTGAALMLIGFMARVPHPASAAPPAQPTFLQQVVDQAGTAPATGPATDAPAPATATPAPAATVPSAPVVRAAPAPLPPATTSRAS